MLARPYLRIVRSAVAHCDSFFTMAQNARFALGLRVLTVLAGGPDAMHTSASIAAELGESAVMVRRTFLVLHSAGLITQRKGPNGGAQLKVPAKQIGLGDIFEASAGEWLGSGDPAVASLLKRARADAIAAMNETTIAHVVKKMKKK